MRILLVTPPMVQINAPYPATAYLAAALGNQGHDVRQVDASLKLALRIFSRVGLASLLKAMPAKPKSSSVRHVLTHKRLILDTLEPTLRFLQGRAPGLARRIASRRLLPEGPRFAALEASEAHSLGRHDFAMHIASLYLDDLADAIREGVDSRFELARYGESLAASAPTFDPLAAALRRPPSPVDKFMEDIARELVAEHRPDLVGFTLPFPGNVYGALRMAAFMKRQKPGLPVVMGGGYVNTELRSLTEPQLFDYTDFLTLDDGEVPLQRIVAHLEGTLPRAQLVRTYIRQAGRVRYLPGPASALSPISNLQSTISNLQSRISNSPDYIAMIESPNPMHRIWSCGRWNKIMMAHGCYWHRCAFCDTSLDYIQRYAPAKAADLAGQIRAITRQTGYSGFHFIDEAMPPAVCRALSQELIRRRIRIRWWGNIRFDKGFTPELARLMAKAGCMAVTGGLEATTPRLLALLDKGFTLEQAARVTHTFADAGIMVHAYLMYGCPSQTTQDTVDALEFVRQLFEAGCIQSAYWHRFALTLHSPIHRNPARYGLTLVRRPKPTFACNEVPFRDKVKCDHAALGAGLRKALYNYMHHTGLDLDLQAWFDHPVPPPTLPTDFVAQAL